MTHSHVVVLYLRYSNYNYDPYSPVISYFMVNRYAIGPTFHYFVSKRFLSTETTAGDWDRTTWLEKKHI